MPEFDQIQLNAMNLPTRISGLINKIGCSMFFPTLPLNKEIIKDIQIISLVAKSLDKENDYDLMRYLQDPTIHSSLTPTEFMEFKTKALIGCYLVKLHKYNSEKILLDRFYKDLEINSLNESTIDIDSCLETFTKFCGFVFEYQDKKTIYSDLNTQFQNSNSPIQGEIHKARFSNSSTASSFIYDIWSSGMHALGIKY